MSQPCLSLRGNKNNIINSNHSQAWIQNLAESFVSKNIVKQYRLNSSLSRVRIAILDTGYDAKTQFFQRPSRKKRIVQWKDLVGGQDEHVDCDGHGTHVLSLAMKVAPGAEICVARVANSAEDLTHSESRIADVRDRSYTQLFLDLG